MWTIGLSGEILSYIADLGFPPLQPTATLKSIAHLIPNKKKRCGIYLLALPNNHFYIGQSNEVVRRYAQHLFAYDAIVGFSFIPIRAVSDRDESLGIPKGLQI